MGKPRLVQRLADKGDVITRPAAAARQCHKDGQTVGSYYPERIASMICPTTVMEEAGVVVDVFEACFNGGAVIVIQNFQVVAVLMKNLLQNVKMDGTHLWCKDGIAFLKHLSGKLGAAVGGRFLFRLQILFPPHIHGGQQTTDTDARCAEIVHLVNFQDRIKLVAALQDFADLVGRHGVQTAAEGIELDQFQIIPLSDKFRRRIQTGMVTHWSTVRRGRSGVKSSGRLSSVKTASP